MTFAKKIVLAVVMFILGVTLGGYFSPFMSNKSPIDKVFVRLPTSPAAGEAYSQYIITTKAKSYFARDDNGRLVPDNKGESRYFKKAEAEYSYQRTLTNNKTALIVMDPWSDSGDDYLNGYYKPLLANKVVPLVLKAIELQIPVFVITNDKKMNSADYGSDIDPMLQELGDKGRISVLFHQDFDEDKFAAFMRDKSIDSLIYSGIASNMCVIGRATGMIPMKIKGFRLFFVPEASAAVEFKGSWDSGYVHAATTSVISQWVGELIDLDDFLKLVPTARKLN